MVNNEIETLRSLLHDECRALQYTSRLANSAPLNGVVEDYVGGYFPRWTWTLDRYREALLSGVSESRAAGQGDSEESFEVEIHPEWGPSPSRLRIQIGWVSILWVPYSFARFIAAAGRFDPSWELLAYLDRAVGGQLWADAGLSLGPGSLQLDSFLEKAHHYSKR